MAATPREALQRRGLAETKVELNGGAAPPREDPLDRAYEDHRMARALAVEEADNAEMAARRATANYERAKADAETAKLHRELQEMNTQARGGGGNEVMLALVNMLQGDKATLVEANKDLSAQIGQIQQTIASGLRTEVASATNADAMSVVTQNIATFKAMMEAVKAMMPEPTPSVAATAPVGSVQDQIALMKAEAEIKRETFKWDEQHAEHMADWDLRRRELDHRLVIDREKHETDKRRADGIGNMLERAGPALMGVFTDVARNRFGPTGAAAAEAVSEAMPTPMTHVQCDATKMDGTICGVGFEVPMGAETVACPACHTLQTVRDL